MADFDRVWGEEERAKLNRTLINTPRLTDIEPCGEARARIIQLLAENDRLNAILKEAGIAADKNVS